jgi:hypothetical protein
MLALCVLCLQLVVALDVPSATTTIASCDTPSSQESPTKRASSISSSDLLQTVTMAQEVASRVKADLAVWHHDMLTVSAAQLQVASS